MKFPKKKKALKQISLQNLLKEEESPSSSSSPSFIKDLSLALPPGLFLMFTNGPVPRIRFSSSPPQSFHWQPRDLSVWRTTPDSSASRETNLRGTMDGTLLSQACDNTIPESWNRCSVSFAFHLSTSARPVLSLIRLPQAPLLAANEGKILSNTGFSTPEKILTALYSIEFLQINQRKDICSIK